MPLQFERMRFATERLVSSSRSQIETEAATLLRHGSLSGGLSVSVCRWSTNMNLTATPP
jgi:hypothetical protein